MPEPLEIKCDPVDLLPLSVPPPPAPRQRWRPVKMRACEYRRSVRTGSVFFEMVYPWDDEIITGRSLILGFFSERGCDPIFRILDVFGIDLVADIITTNFGGRDGCCAAAHERIKNNFPSECVQLYQPIWELYRIWRWMPHAPSRFGWETPDRFCIFEELIFFRFFLRELLRKGR